MPNQTIEPESPVDAGATVRTLIPARLDRLPWGPFHTLVVAALGITWIFDGLEVTLAGAVAAAVKADLGLTDSASALPPQPICWALSRTPYSSAG